MTAARNAWGLAAIIVVCAFLSACDSTTEPTTPKSFDTVTAISVASATGTVRLVRATSARDYQNGTGLQSSYSRSSSTNREVRRAIIEFPLITLDGTLHKAVLSVKPNAGRTMTPVPPDTHVVSWYKANRLVELTDFDRGASQIATFLTDNNDEVRPTLYFEVTDALRAVGNASVGFRIELKNDMSMSADGVAGMSFNGMNGAGAPELIVTTLKEK